MPLIHDIVVAESDADFDALLRLSAMEAEFLTGTDSDRFSEKNGRLRDAMERAVIAHLGDDLAESDTHIGYDWWPDHTRHIDVSERAFRFEMFELLRSLLTGEFDEWRIQAVVYAEIMKGTTMIGSVLIWWDKLIVDQRLFDWMQAQRFSFPSAHVRHFSLSRDDLESSRYNIMNDPS
jgi:hypothetical protein